jgi:hypothetical protein
MASTSQIWIRCEPCQCVLEVFGFEANDFFDSPVHGEIPFSNAYCLGGPPDADELSEGNLRDVMQKIGR